MRETALGYLVPPKLRSKGRSQGISRVTSWAAKILEIFNSDRLLGLLPIPPEYYA